MRRLPILHLGIAALALAAVAAIWSALGPPRRPLLESADDGDLSQVRRHVLWASDVNKRGAESVSEFPQQAPLCVAMSRGRWEACKLLIEAGADVKTTNLTPYEKDRRTILHHAANVGPADLVELLIAHGADVNARTESGATPLHDAARAGRNAAVKVLLAHGARIDAFDTQFGDMTPLTMAVQAGWADTAELLLARGAKPGRLSLNMAVEAGRKDITAMLPAAGADLGPVDHRCVVTSLEQAPPAVRAELARMIQLARARREQAETARAARAQARMSGILAPRQLSPGGTRRIWILTCLALAFWQWWLLRHPLAHERHRGTFWAIAIACRVCFLAVFLLAGTILTICCL
jgi:hypothetical protein